MNKLFATQQEIGKIADKVEQTKAMYLAVLEYAVSVEGFNDENDKPYSIEAIRNLDIDIQLASSIIRAFNRANGSEDDTEKKSSASAPSAA